MSVTCRCFYDLYAIICFCNMVFQSNLFLFPQKKTQPIFDSVHARFSFSLPLIRERGWRRKSWWSREVGSSRSTYKLLSVQVTAGRWCILCWVYGWRVTVLVPSFDVVVMRGCQFWSLMACPWSCCPGLIISTTMVCPMANYFGRPKSRWTAMEPHRARVKRWSVYFFFFGGCYGGAEEDG